MNRIKIVLILLSTLVIFGCDPEFEHEFTGRIISKENNEPLELVKLEYSFFPTDNSNHWRSNVMDRDSIKYTNENGQFKIKFSTLSMSFDSLKIILSKEGYKKETLISEQKEWKSRFGFNFRKFKFNFREIYLEKNKTGGNNKM